MSRLNDCPPEWIVKVMEAHRNGQDVSDVYNVEKHIFFFQDSPFSSSTGIMVFVRSILPLWLTLDSKTKLWLEQSFSRRNIEMSK